MLHAACCTLHVASLLVASSVLVREKETFAIFIMSQMTYLFRCSVAVAVAVATIAQVGLLHAISFGPQVAASRLQTLDTWRTRGDS